MISDIGALKEKTFFHRPLFFFQIRFLSLHQMSKDIFAFIEATTDVFVISIMIVPFSFDQLAYY